ncbi:MAG: tetratricopeptide repeat protein [Bryobacterales bacterium]|nr:tetratricopeptide repeat protein [Bryobacterales bacterium]
MPRPIYLSGKVVLEDGTPPPEPAVIERVCNGIVRPEGYTDSKGRFSIQLGQNTQYIADASWGGDASYAGMGSAGRDASSMGGFGNNPGISERDLMGCELRASLAGYLSDRLPLAGRRALDNPNVGIIVIRRFGNVEGTTISATSLAAPNNARKAYDKGIDARKKEKWADARKQFDLAVKAYPRYAAAWYELGFAAEKMGDLEAARQAYAQALDSDGKFVKPYLQLAGMSARGQNWEELAQTTSQVLRLDPYNYPQIYYFNAVAQLNLRHVDEAEKSARQAVKMDKQNQFPGANHVLGVILAAKGEMAEAAGYLKAYLKLAPAAPDAEVARKRLATIEAAAADAVATAQPQ